MGERVYTPEGVAVGARARRIRQASGRSQRDVADRMGLDPSVISNMEAGGSPWTPDRVKAYSQAVGCSPQELIAPLDDEAVEAVVQVRPRVVIGRLRPELGASEPQPVVVSVGGTLVEAEARLIEEGCRAVRAELGLEVTAADWIIDEAPLPFVFVSL